MEALSLFVYIVSGSWFTFYGGILLYVWIKDPDYPLFAFPPIAISTVLLAATIALAVT